MAEPASRFWDVVEALALDDVAIFVWDARGHGRSPGGDRPDESIGVPHQGLEGIRMAGAVRSVGFEKIGMEIDDHGLFTVSVARLRRAS